MTLPDGFGDGQALQALDENQQRLAKHGYGVVSGASVSLGTGNLGSGEATVDVAAGTLLVGGTSTSTTATSVAISASDSNPRKDLIVYDTGSSSFTAIGGVPASAVPDGALRQQARRPAPDSLDSSVVAVSGSGDPQIPLAEVWVPADATGISSDDIFDRRNSVNVSLNSLGVESITGPISSGTAITDITGGNLFINNGELSAANMRTDVQDNGTGVVSNTTTLNFGANMSVTDPGDGSATIDGADTVSRAAKTFGAFVNGGHSDFADAQAAINFADTTSHIDTVVFPPGDYGAISIPAGVSIQGGARSPNNSHTAVFSSSSGPAITLSAGRIAVRNCAAENTSSASATEHAILAQGFQNRIEGVFLAGAGDDGIHSTNSDALEVHNCTASTGSIASDSIVLDSDTSAAIITNNPAVGTITDNGTNNVVSNNS